MSKNDITGDTLRSRPLSPEGKANWDTIFGKKPAWPSMPESDTMPSTKPEPINPDELPEAP